MTTSQSVGILIAAVCGFWVIGAYNRLVRQRSAIGAAWLPLAQQLRGRHRLADLLADQAIALEPMTDAPGRSTIDTVAAAVRQADAAVDHAHGRPAHAGAIQSLGLAEQVLDGALRSLKMLLEERTLDSEPLRITLAALQDSDGQGAFVRRQFNDAVFVFNQSVHEVPTRVVAGLFGLRPSAPLQLAYADRGPDSQYSSAFGERL